MRWAHGGCWSRVDTCVRPIAAATCSTVAPLKREFYEFDGPRVATGNDHGGGDTLAAATACALAHGFTVPDAVGFGKRWVTECLRAAYPLGGGHGPGLPAVPAVVMNLEQIAGVAHEPEGDSKFGPKRGRGIDPRRRRQP